MHFCVFKILLPVSRQSSFTAIRMPRLHTKGSDGLEKNSWICMPKRSNWRSAWIKRRRGGGRGRGKGKVFSLLFTRPPPLRRFFTLSWIYVDGQTQATNTPAPDLKGRYIRKQGLLPETKFLKAHSIYWLFRFKKLVSKIESCVQFSRTCQKPVLNACICETQFRKGASWSDFSRFRPAKWSWTVH